ncbi:MAG: ABC transporter permease subunit [Spirochaetaceae bacterium]|nr:ABC transporter permease subunit [Spirochaetaceae bacterium]
MAALFAVSALLLAYALLWIAFSALPSNYVDSLIPRFRTALNFIQIFSEDALARPFLNTLLVSLAAALLTPLLVLPAARALSGAGTGLKAAAFAIAQALGAAGGMHSLVPLYAMARAAGLLDTYIPLLFVNLFHAAPFALFTATAFLERLPRSAEEAAELDGASPATRLFRITLPLALPSLAAGAMAAFLSAWNSFLAPLVLLNDDSMFTIGVRLYSYVGSVASGSPKWNRFAAASVVNLVAIGAVMLRARGSLGSDAAAHQDD